MFLNVGDVIGCWGCFLMLRMIFDMFSDAFVYLGCFLDADDVFGCFSTLTEIF